MNTSIPCLSDRIANELNGGQELESHIRKQLGGSVRITKLDVAVAKVPEKWRTQLRMNTVLRS